MNSDPQMSKMLVRACLRSIVQEWLRTRRFPFQVPSSISPIDRKTDSCKFKFVMRNPKTRSQPIGRLNCSVNVAAFAL